MKKKNILVTATGGRSVGSGILHALTRCSAEVRDRWNVIAADADPFAWGLYKVEKSVLLPNANSPNYLEKLNNAINKFSIDAIIPGSEPEVNLLSKSFAEFSVPIITNRHELMPLMMDKFKMVEALKKFGLPYIETYPVDNWQEAVAKYKFPFILKPTVGTGGSKGLHFIFSESELLSILPSLDRQAFYCVQPYIGNGEEEYTVGILSDKSGQVIDSIVMKRKLSGLSLLYSKTEKNTNYTISTGYSQGYIIKMPEIQTFCEKLAVLINSTGPLNIQLRVHDGEIYVFEIHPRFSGTTPIRADVGFNEPDILLRNHLNNETFGRLNYQYDVAAIRAFEHVIVPINKML